jgi:sugar/nucleoside kinase (ribokinase family)
MPRGDACALCGLAVSTTPEQILDTIVPVYPQATIVVTLGKEGAIAYEPPGTILRQAAIPAEEVG